MASQRIIFTITVLIVAFAAGDGLSQKLPVFKQPAHVFPQTLSWWDSIYLYPNFKQGYITYLTGFTPEQQLSLNYNLYYGQMDLIDQRGDTVRVNPLKTIRSIQVDGDKFYLDAKKGYLRVVVHGEITLVEHSMLRLYRWQYVSGNIGENGGEAGTDLRGRPSIYDKYYVNAPSYLFIDKDYKVHKPSKAFLKRVFPEYKSAIDQYMLIHNVNFLDKENLVAVTNFCNHLRRIPNHGDRAMLVSAGERASTALADSVFRFPEFKDGVVAYQDGSIRQYAGGLNYNLLRGEVEAIENGDTVRIRNRESITTVNVDGITYIRKQAGYLEILLSGPVSLGVTRRIILTHSQSVLAASRYEPGNSYDPSISGDEVANYDRLYAKENKYYFIDKRGDTWEASALSAVRADPSRKRQINEYIALHHPDFDREKDLKDLITYLAKP